MSSSGLESEVLRYVEDLLGEHGVEHPPVRPDTPLLSSRLLESMAVLTLAAWIEEKIGRELDLTEIDFRREWNDVASIARFIERCLLKS